MCKLFLLCVFGLMITQVRGQWSCDVTSDCIGLDDGECVDGRCMCPKGLQVDEERTGCMLSAPYLNSPCDKDIQCQHLATGYTCHNETNVCACKAGFRYLRGRCWPAAKFGEPCVSSGQCYDALMPLSLACKSGFCACADNHYFRERGACRKISSKIGDSCVLNDDCQIPTVPKAVCDINKLICTNPDATTVTASLPNDFEDGEIYSDVSRIKEGDACIKDSDCAELGQAVCSSRQCICSPGYFPRGDKLLCGAELGMKAANQSFCIGFGSKLLNGICDCPAGYFFLDFMRNCKKPARKLGDSCVDDNVCFTFGSSAKCSKPDELGLKKCYCDLTISTEDEAKQFCAPLNKGIGDSCEKIEDCPNNVQCIDDVCSCGEDETADSFGTSCLQQGLDIGSNCSISSQCKGDNSSCVGGRCSCDDGFFENNMTCILGLGGTCFEDVDCQVPNSLCKNSTGVFQCECADGYVKNETVCYKLVTGALDICLVDSQCWPALGDNSTAQCSDGKCRCTSDSHLRDMKCWKKTGLREVCSRSSQCYLKQDIFRTECRNSQCQCKLGYKETYSPDICSGTITLQLSISYIIMLINILYIFN